MEFPRQTGDDGSSPPLPLLPIVDHLANIPIEADQFGVRRHDGAGLSRTNPGFDIFQEALKGSG